MAHNEKRSNFKCERFTIGDINGFFGLLFALSFSRKSKEGHAPEHY